jgi:peptide/nickel transport system substrate-binding protein
VIHREYFHSDGAFRVGPVLPEFEVLMGRSVVETDPTKLGDLGKELDKLVYDEILNVFQCCPQALVAVNKHEDFTGHTATLELAETQVGGGHWSYRNGG